MHTHFSEGTYSPEEIVQESLRAGLACIAITDHDTAEGIPPTLNAAQQYDLEIIPGIELSTEIDKKDIHILGYFIDFQNKQLNEKLMQFQNARVERIKEMLQKLKEEGIDNIAFEEVEALTRSDSIGRPHLAALLIKKGWVSTHRQAFERFLGEECSAYVPKLKQTPHEVIDLIHQAGGLAVLAHPMITNRNELIPGFVEAGLDGMEVYYPNCSMNVVRFYEKIAKRNNLLMTGGSDAHGETRLIGSVKVSYELVEQMKERKDSYK